MDEAYEPPSDFLKAILADEVPLAGSEFAAANLRRLIALTRDENIPNRDWATFLLGQQEVDTPDVRSALLAAAKDPDQSVRAEAILGLAKLDPSLALPLLREELAQESVMVQLFEAATLVAHPSLAESLREFASPSAGEVPDACAAEALRACETGKRG